MYLMVDSRPFYASASVSSFTLLSPFLDQSGFFCSVGDARGETKERRKNKKRKMHYYLERNKVEKKNHCRMRRKSFS